MKLNFTPKLLAVSLAAATSFSMWAQTTQDVTSYITNPSFEANGAASWTNSGLKSQTNNDFPMKEGGTYLEKWVSQGTSVGNASISQTISVPAGKYKLTVGAMNYDQNNTEKECSGAVIFADEVTAPVYTPADYSLDFVCVTGKVTIGFRATSANGNWVAVDNFRLYYTGEADAADVVAQIKSLVEIAKTYQGKTMNDGVAATLNSVIARGEAVTTATPVSESSALIQEINSAIDAAIASIADYESLAKVLSEAESLQSSMMSATASTALTTAINAGKAVTGATSVDGIKVIIADIETAIADAKTSISNYLALKKAIAAAEKWYDESKVGAAEFKAELDAAKQMVVDPLATPEELAQEIKDLDKAALVFNMANASGVVPEVTTNPYIARGCLIAFGRLSVVNDVEIYEQGFCYSTDTKEPTVLDERSSSYYDHKGKIFYMKDIKPCTIYYMRAYAISKDFQVGYGDAVKVVTLPEATCTWSWNRNDATDEEDARCRAAIAEAIEDYNYCSAFKGFHLTGNYSKGAGAGDGTADCSYGGWMRISQNVPYQRTGTVQHETNHGVGVGTTERWYSCSDLRKETSRGYWLGPRANELVRFFENAEDVCVTGDGTHMWATSPNGTVTGLLNYGINGAHEDSGSKLLYYANAMVTEFLCEDGLCPTSSYPNGVPCYTFDFEPEKKYYLVSENPEMGLNTAGFITIIDENGSVKWAPSAEVNDSMAWNIEYDLESGYYRFKNVVNGKYITYSSVPTSAKVDTPTKKEEFQLMPGRSSVTVGLGNSQFTATPYWLTAGSVSGGVATNYAIAVQALGDNGQGNVRRMTFKFGNKDTDQRFLILSEDQIADYRKAIDSTSSIASTLAPQTKEVEGIYSVDGIRRADTVTGVNIIRYTDGSSVKVVK